MDTRVSREVHALIKGRRGIHLKVPNIISDQHANGLLASRLAYYSEYCLFPAAAKPAECGAELNSLLIQGTPTSPANGTFFAFATNPSS